VPVLNSGLLQPQGAIERGKFHKESGKVDVQSVLSIAEEVASGMAFLHANGIVHGNLSASSILLTFSQVRQPFPLPLLSQRRHASSHRHCEEPTSSLALLTHLGVCMDARPASFTFDTMAGSAAAIRPGSFQRRAQQCEL